MDANEQSPLHFLVKLVTDEDESDTSTHEDPPYLPTPKADRVKDSIEPRKNGKKSGKETRVLKEEIRKKREAEKEQVDEEESDRFEGLEKEKKRKKKKKKSKDEDEEVPEPLEEQAELVEGKSKNKRKSSIPNKLGEERNEHVNENAELESAGDVSGLDLTFEGYDADNDEMQGEADEVDLEVENGNPDEGEAKDEDDEQMTVADWKKSRVEIRKSLGGCLKNLVSSIEVTQEMTVSFN
jgi:hypothetical protein